LLPFLLLCVGDWSLLLLLRHLSLQERLLLSPMLLLAEPGWQTLRQLTWV
jgi:hypothetical protein